MNYDARFLELIADHQRMQEEYEALAAAGYDVDVNKPTLAWQQWYERFLPIKNRMYRLAHDLDIPFATEVASAEDYAQVWEAIRDRLGTDGNRRAGMNNPVEKF